MIRTLKDFQNESIGEYVKKSKLLDHTDTSVKDFETVTFIISNINHKHEIKIKKFMTFARINIKLKKDILKFDIEDNKNKLFFKKDDLQNFITDINTDCKCYYGIDEDDAYEYSIHKRKLGEKIDESINDEYIIIDESAVGKLKSGHVLTAGATILGFAIGGPVAGILALGIGLLANKMHGGKDNKDGFFSKIFGHKPTDNDIKNTMASASLAASQESANKAKKTEEEDEKQMAKFMSKFVDKNGKVNLSDLGPLRDMERTMGSDALDEVIKRSKEVVKNHSNSVMASIKGLSTMSDENKKRLQETAELQCKVNQAGIDKAIKQKEMDDLQQEYDDNKDDLSDDEKKELEDKLKKSKSEYDKCEKSYNEINSNFTSSFLKLKKDHITTKLLDAGNNDQMKAALDAEMDQSKEDDKAAAEEATTGLDDLTSIVNNKGKEKADKIKEKVDGLNKNSEDLEVTNTKLSTEINDIEEKIKNGTATNDEQQRLETAKQEKAKNEKEIQYNNNEIIAIKDAVDKCKNKKDESYNFKDLNQLDLDKISETSRTNTDTKIDNKQSQSALLKQQIKDKLDKKTDDLINKQTDLNNKTNEAYSKYVNEKDPDARKKAQQEYLDARRNSISNQAQINNIKTLSTKVDKAKDATGLAIACSLQKKDDGSYEVSDEKIDNTLSSSNIDIDGYIKTEMAKVNDSVQKLEKADSVESRAEAKAQLASINKEAEAINDQTAITLAKEKRDNAYIKDMQAAAHRPNAEDRNEEMIKIYNNINQKQPLSAGDEAKLASVKGNIQNFAKNAESEEDKKSYEELLTNIQKQEKAYKDSINNEKYEPVADGDGNLHKIIPVPVFSTKGEIAGYKISNDGTVSDELISTNDLKDKIQKTTTEISQYKAPQNPGKLSTKNVPSEGMRVKEIQNAYNEYIKRNPAATEEDLKNCKKELLKQMTTGQGAWFKDDNNEAEKLLNGALDETQGFVKYKPVIKDDDKLVFTAAATSETENKAQLIKAYNDWLKKNPTATDEERKNALTEYMVQANNQLGDKGSNFIKNHFMKNGEIDVNKLFTDEDSGITFPKPSKLNDINAESEEDQKKNIQDTMSKWLKTHPEANKTGHWDAAYDDLKKQLMSQGMSEDKADDILKKSIGSESGFSIPVGVTKVDITDEKNKTANIQNMAQTYQDLLNAKAAQARATDSSWSFENLSEDDKAKFREETKILLRQKYKEAGVNDDNAFKNIADSALKNIETTKPAMKKDDAVAAVNTILGGIQGDLNNEAKMKASMQKAKLTFIQYAEENNIDITDEASRNKAMDDFLNSTHDGDKSLKELMGDKNAEDFKTAIASDAEDLKELNDMNEKSGAGKDVDKDDNATSDEKDTEQLEDGSTLKIYHKKGKRGGLYFKTVRTYPAEANKGTEYSDWQTDSMGKGGKKRSEIERENIEKRAKKKKPAGEPAATESLLNATNMLYESNLTRYIKARIKIKMQ